MPDEIHGALIVATGAVEHEAASEAGRRSGSVMTQAELATSLAKGSVEGRSVVMLQCVGSRNDEHPYCSRTCCADALRNALGLKREDPAREITILHRGIRVWGFDEELLSEALDLGVEFIEVKVTPEVVLGGEPGDAGAERGTPTVRGTTVDGDALALEPDLVVLSAGVEPSAGTGALAKAVGAELASDGFFDRAGAVCGDTGDLRVYACGRAAGPADLNERVLQARAAAGKACLYLKRGSDEA
jgi:heterodisulfide reductase subunit A